MTVASNCLTLFGGALLSLGVLNNYPVQLAIGYFVLAAALTVTLLQLKGKIE